MKKTIVLIGIFFSLASIRAQTSIITLPLTLEKGFGNFDYYFFGLKWDDTSKLKQNITSKITGVPNTLKNIKYAVIYLEPYQFIYQSYIAKAITLKEFKHFQDALSWKPDPKRLVKQNINCYVTVLSAERADGKQIYMVDKNHNYSFNDEEILILVDSKASENEILNNLITFKCQRYANGKIISDSATISIVKSNDALLFSMAEYATTEFSISGKKYYLQICPLLFLSRSFIKSAISVSDGGKTDNKIDHLSTIKDGDYIHFGNLIYKHMGVDIFSNTLKLKKVNVTEYYSPQIGYYAPPFKEYSINEKSPVSIDQYKGKYLFIDFWGTWCKPCLADIDHLKKGFSNLDSNRIAMLGILSSDKLDYAQQFIKARDIKWNQILSDSITDQYRVTAFPTNFLIDPRGKIIAKNIRPEFMVEEINKIIDSEE